MEAFFNTNEFIRNNLRIVFDETAKKGYDKEISCELLTDFYHDMHHSDKLIDRLFYLTSVTCMYADAYKILADSYRKNTFSRDDAWFFYFLQGQKSIPDFLEETDNPNILYDLIRYSSNYNDMNELGKRSIFKKLSLDEHKQITRMNNVHKLDNKIYGDYVPTSRYVRFFEEEEIQNNAILNVDQIENIENFLKELYKTDKKNFNDNFFDMLKVYYKWTKYMTYNDPKVEQINEKLKMISLIEKNSLESLGKVAVESKDFLYNLIDEYIYHSLIPTEEIKRGKEKIIVTEEMVDAFIKKNSNKTVLEKLGFIDKQKKK